MKLYPPQIEGTLPSFYKNSEKGTILTVPFSMNKAVSINEVYGYSLKVKDVINGDTLFIINTKDHQSSTEAKFSIESSNFLQLVVGSYYKIQIAYIDKNEETGYYSTVGVIKYTSSPTVLIENLVLEKTNNHQYSYTGYYNNENDPTEKVYYYQFILTDNNNNIISDSGKQIHINKNNNLTSYESIDKFNFISDLESDKIYLIQYIITTNNNMIAKSPKYRLIQSSAQEMTENIKLQAELNYDEGYIYISAIQNKQLDNIYTLCEANSFNLLTNYYKREYKKIELNYITYVTNQYYINENNQFILDDSEEFDIGKIYYESYYTLIKISETQYQPNTYYLKNEHYVRGNFLISRSCKDTEYQEWNEIATIKIDGYGDNIFNWKDFTIEQGKYYKYSIQQYNNYGVLSKRIITDEIFADFEDLFLYDGERQLKIRYNPKVSSFKINKLINKVDTIGGKYPYIFSNAQTYYKEFPISGLISYKMDGNEFFIKATELGFDDQYNNLTRDNNYEINQLKNEIRNIYFQLSGTTLPYNYLELETKKEKLQAIYEKKIAHQNIIDNNKYPTHNLISTNIAAERTFKLEVLDWLNNGKPKLFRTPEEGNYIVILTNTSLSPEEKINRMLHSFSSTAYEIADFTYENLRELDILEKTELNQNFLAWKTINLSEPRNLNDGDNNNFILDSDNKLKIIYKGDIQYNYSEMLDGIQAYSIYFSGLIPNTIVYLDDEEIVIGATGNYYIESETGFSSILIPANNNYRGSLTYSYYTSAPSAFDLIINQNINYHVGEQFFGDNTNLLDKINTTTSSVVDFGFLQFKARDIIKVQIDYETNNWYKTYYLNQDCETQVFFDLDEIDLNTDIYYYINTDATDGSCEKVKNIDDFTIGTTYYKNNQMLINPLYYGNEEDIENYYCVLQERFLIDNNIITYIYNNKYPLYQYQTDKIIQNNEVVKLINDEDELMYLRLYKDLYNDKYYIDDDTYNDLSSEEQQKILNIYKIELLNFNVILDNNIIQTGPGFTHTKVGKLFSKEEASLENKTYENFIFYTTADCSTQKIGITETNCEDFYIFDYINTIINFKHEIEVSIKGQYNFNSIILGNGVVLNCAYNTKDIQYALEDLNNINNKYYDAKLNYIQEQLNEYQSIMNNVSDSLGFENIALTDLNSIVEYYKNLLLDEIKEINEDDETSFDDTTLVIDEYSKFLIVYNQYLNGELTTLTEFINVLSSNNTLTRTINSLIKEKIIIHQNAKKQYLKYLSEYNERIKQLLTIYSEEEEINNEESNE